MTEFYGILITIGICMWLCNIFLCCMYFKHPMMWRSKWFVITALVPGMFLSPKLRTKIRYELFDIVLHEFDNRNSRSRFVLIEKSNRLLRKPRRCAVCSETPTSYSTFNTFEFFMDGLTEIGLSCKCGEYTKKFEFGFLHLTYGNYATFLNSIGTTFKNSVTNDWNRSGYLEEKTKKEKPRTIL